MSGQVDQVDQIRAEIIRLSKDPAASGEYLRAMNDVMFFIIQMYTAELRAMREAGQAVQDAKGEISTGSEIL